MKVTGAYCKSCKVTVYSRHRHDFRHCKCWANEVGNLGVAIDGGRDYLKISAGSSANYILKEVEVCATQFELAEDWKNNTSKYGMIR